MGTHTLHKTHTTNLNIIITKTFQLITTILTTITIITNSKMIRNIKQRTQNKPTIQTKHIHTMFQQMPANSHDQLKKCLFGYVALQAMVVCACTISKIT